MRLKSRPTDETGIALVTALLAVMLISGLMAGMFAAIQADQRGSAIDRDQTQAYAAAHAGLEQLTSSLATLFVTDVSPSVTQINTLAATPPDIPGFEFVAPGGVAGSGYAISYTDANGDNIPDTNANADITTGPLTGFRGLITPYIMTVTARSTGSGHSEVRLRRGLQTVAVPVFQFGMFSDSDLSVFAGGGLSFGGRVHTNGSLFVAAQTGAGNTVTFSDRITAVNEVVRNYLSNGLNSGTSAPSFNQDVRIPKSASTFDVLKQTPNMGSVAVMPGSAPNTNWTSISTGTFKSYIRTGLTGAKRLDLPLVSQGAEPVDLIRRPAVNSNENTTNPAVFGQRYFSQASLRILLSDRLTDFTGLPTITVTPPVLLDGPGGAAGTWNLSPPAGYVVGANRPPIARSIGPASTITVNGSRHGGGLSQIYVANNPAAIPPVFKLQGLRVRLLPIDQPITCLGKSGPNAVPTLDVAPAVPINSFFGCTGVPAVGAGSQVVAIVDGREVVANVANALAAGAAEITVGANETAPFSPNLFWMNNPNATVADTAVPVTCEGYSDVGARIPAGFTGAGTFVRRFLNCRGLSAAPVNNQPITTSALAAQDTGTIGGYIKIEKQDNAGTWTDVTMEILNLGFGAQNSGGFVCNDPTPTAVIRIQRLRDNGTPAVGGACTYNNSLDSRDWWPNTLYDAREGVFRDSGAVAGTTTSPMVMGGVMQYISIDVNNLRRWVTGQIGTTGNQALNNNGYIVYFSDRRGNHDAANGGVETGEYGFEDHINSTSGAGTPDGVLQAGEDVNGNGTQQTYGQFPWNDPVNIPAGAAPPYTAAIGRPWTPIPLSSTNGGTVGAGLARVNKVVLFRRALKLVNGGLNNLPQGFTVASENPVYVHGNYNATAAPPAANWTNQEPNVPASIVADAITVLSNAWLDARSFEVPNMVTERDATMTGYRFAAVAGKGRSFTYCAAACGNPGQLYGTDGGAANFLRMLEDWASGINYRGSLISLHINRQAVGAYKFNVANNHIYNGGPRNFTFDIDFLTPALLPPGTPMFRDVNTLQFRQILRPNQ
jgi:hypothetical protein